MLFRYFSFCARKKDFAELAFGLFVSLEPASDS
jgi:hypothetical protein